MANVGVSWDLASARGEYTDEGAIATQMGRHNVRISYNKKYKKVRRVNQGTTPSITKCRSTCVSTPLPSRATSRIPQQQLGELAHSARCTGGHPAPLR